MLFLRSLSATLIVVCLEQATSAMLAAQSVSGETIKQADDQAVLQVEKLLYSGNWRSALDAARNAQRQGVRSPRLHELAALTAMYTMNPAHAEKAVRSAKAALRHDVNDANLQATYAMALLLSNNLKDGLKHAQAAVMLDEKNARAHAVLGLALDLMGQNQDAFKEMKRAASINPAEPDVCYMSFRMRRNHEDLEGASRAFDGWIKGHPDHGLPHFMRGMHCDTYEMREQAFNDLSIAIEKNPQNAQALQRRARLAYERKQWDQAARDWEAVSKLKSENMYMLARRARCYSRMKQYDKAIAAYTALLDRLEHGELVRENEMAFFVPYVSRSNPLPYIVARAEQYEKLGDRERALNDARSVLSRDPENVGALDIVQRLSRKEKDYERALTCLSALIDIDPDVPYWRIERADVYTRLGMKSRASEDLKKAAIIEERGMLPKE